MLQSQDKNGLTSNDPELTTSGAMETPAVEKLTEQVQGQVESASESADKFSPRREQGFAKKGARVMMGSLMQRLEQKVEEMPDKGGNALEDRIKTMIHPLKNENSRKWNGIIKQAENDYLHALKVTLDNKAGWIKVNFQKRYREFVITKVSSRKEFVIQTFTGYDIIYSQDVTNTRYDPAITFACPVAVHSETQA